MSTYIVDALMIGRLSHSALSISASSLGNTIYYTLVFCAIKVFTGLETLAAQSFGRESPEGRREAVHLFGQSLWVVILGTPLVMLGTLACIPMLTVFGISAELVGETSRYLHALIWSTAPLLLYMAIRHYLQAVNRVLLITVSLVTANLVNWAGDYAFLFGHFGFHPLGIAGSGWATCIVRLYMLGFMFAAFRLSSRTLQTRFTFDLLRPSLTRMRRIMRIGWPEALENITDLGFSTYMSILCARLGTTLLAAHQVVLDLDAFVYMVPLGLSYATVVRVGQSAGQGSVPAIRRSANVSAALGMGYICIASALFAGLPRLWGSMYTNDPNVVAAAVPIFAVCGFLQLGDAANILYSSALAGLGDTRAPFFINTVTSWLIGAPMAWFLALHTSWSLTGLWLGRAAAAVLAGGSIAWLWHYRLRQASGEVRQTHSLTLLRPLNAP